MRNGIFAASAPPVMTTPPVITLTSAVTNSAPEFDIVLYNYPAPNDQVEWTRSQSSTFASGNTSTTQTLSQANLYSGTNLGAPFSGVAEGVWYYRARHIRNGTASPWATTLTVVVLSSWTPATMFTNYSEGSFSATKGGIWDFRDATRLRQTSAGTGTVSATDDPVGWVQDYGTGANHLTQATSGNRPTYNGSTYGCNFYVSSVGRWVQNTALASSITSSTMWGMAAFYFEGNMGQANMRMLSTYASAGDDYDGTNRAVMLQQSSSDGKLSSWRNSAKLTTSPSVSGSVRHIAYSKFDGANATVTLDGVDSTPAASTGAFAVTKVSVGGNITGSPTIYFNGSIKGAALIDRVPTATELIYLNAWFGGY
jgi:hypothetical protein